MHTIAVDLKDRSYPIHLGVHVLGQCAELLAQARLGPQVFIITNDTVARLHLEAVRTAFAGKPFTVQVLTIPDGEKFKNQDTVNQLYDELIRARCERSAAIVALGGGVVGDVAGFTAASLLRGVPLVHLPTTLLAQTDSSVGGKVGINHPLGKNLIGAFYQPRLVLADLATLATLPQREFSAGLGEVVKYGVIRDESFFALLENTIDLIVGLEINSLVTIVKTCCEIKAAVVREDETEKGLRAILNYGHTFAHALETVTNYQRYKHGEAVMMGMILAGKTALDLGLWSKADFDRQNRLLVKIFLPKISPRITVRKMIECMRQDKKVRAGSLRLVLPRRIGQVELVNDVPEKTIAGAIDWFRSHSAQTEEA
jgi:3-dehydroquinate synthase